MIREPKSLSSIPRQHIPLNVIHTDMANGCVPRSYLQSITKSGMRSDASVMGLSPCQYPEALNTFRISVSGSGRAPATLIIKDKGCFIALATEALLCGISSVGIVDPAQIAQSYIQSVSRGRSNDFVNSYISTLGVLFIDSVIAPVVTSYLQSSPEAAHYFYSFMKAARYGTVQHIAMDMSAYYQLPPKDNIPLADAVAQAYGYDTASLLLDSAYII